MARYFTRISLAFFVSACAFAQPVINATRVVNAASYLPQGWPGSGIAQGSIFTIQGSGLGPAALTTAGPLPLQTSVGGTSVKVTSGGQTVDCFILAAVSFQVNALLPSNTPTGNATVTVTFGSHTSLAEPFVVVSGSFAPFAFNSAGFGQASATDLNYRQNSIIHTFHPGDWVVLWGTGLGPIAGDDSGAPPVGNLGRGIVHIGNTSLTPYYAGRSAQYPGLDQVMFQVPSGIDGCSVPVAVEINGSIGGAGIIAVSASGATCSDSLMGPDLVNKLAAGDTVGFAFIEMAAIVLRNQSLPTGIGAPDYLLATFSQFTPATAGMASYGISNGYCMPFGNAPDMSLGGLDAGSGITVHGVSTATVPPIYTGYYNQLFNSATNIQFFWSGLQYSISSPGGKSVGSFAATDVTSTPSAYFSGIIAGQTLSIAGDLTVTWTGGDPKLQNGLVTIAGYSVGENNAVGSFICTTPLSSQSFTIPRWVLSTIPPTQPVYVGVAPYPQGFIWIGQFNNPVPFQATGLDRGIVVDEFFNGFPVYFK